MSSSEETFQGKVELIGGKGGWRYVLLPSEIMEYLRVA